MATFQEAKEGLLKIKTFLMNLDDADFSLFSMLNCIEDFCDLKHNLFLKQSLITDFFVKKY